MSSAAELGDVDTSSENSQDSTNAADQHNSTYAPSLDTELGILLALLLDKDTTSDNDHDPEHGADDGRLGVNSGDDSDYDLDDNLDTYGYDVEDNPDDNAEEYSSDDDGSDSTEVGAKDAPSRHLFRTSSSPSTVRDRRHLDADTQQMATTFASLQQFLDDDTSAFFTDDDGVSMLNMHTIQAANSTISLQQSVMSLSSTNTNRPSIFGLRNGSTVSFNRVFRRRHYTPSISTVVPSYGVFNLTIVELQTMIDEHRSLQFGEIMSTEGYFQHAITHRFVVLQLRRDGRKPIWLRLERRAGRSAFNLLLSGGVAPTQDTAQLASDKTRLIGDGHLENRQEFSTPSTLGELRYFLQVISNELTTYRIWPENCWFFCSLLQQHLGGSDDESFVKGSLPLASLAPGIRRRVEEQLRRVFHMPAPFSVTELLLSFERNHPELDTTSAIASSRQWDSLNDCTSSRGRNVANRLRRLLDTIARRLFQDQRHADAELVWAQCVTLARHLHRHDPGRYCSKLALSLNSHGICLHACGRIAEACDVMAEAISLVGGELYENDPALYRPIVADMLHNHAVYLCRTQRFEDSCVAAEKAINHLRHLHRQDPDRYQSDFASALFSYGESLYEDQRIDTACVFSEESVALRRSLYARYPDRYRSEYAASLHLYSVCLLQAPRTKAKIDAANNVALEAVSLRRQLHRLGSEQSLHHLALSLQHHGTCLYEAGHLEQACDVEVEAIELLQQLCDHDVGQHSSYIVELIQLVGAHQAHLQEAGRIDDNNTPKPPSEESTDAAGRKSARSRYISYSEALYPPIDRTAPSLSPETPNTAPPPATNISPTTTRRRPFAVSEILNRLIEVVNSLPADRFLAEKPPVGVSNSRSVKAGGNQATVSVSKDALMNLVRDEVRPELKKEGRDWFALFNPRVPRTFDVNLSLTLTHESLLVAGKSGNMYIRSVCFSPDGKYLATGAEDTLVLVWDISTGVIRHRFEGHTQEVYSIDISRDSKFLVSGSGDGTVRVWNQETYSCIVLAILEPKNIDVSVASVSISPDGRWVAAGSLDCITRVWDLKSGALVERLHGHTDSVYSVRFNPDGCGLVTGSLDKTSKYWDITPMIRAVNAGNWRGLADRVSLRQDGISASIALPIPGGKEEGGGEMGSICTAVSAGHKDYVVSVAVSSDGELAASGSKDYGVLLWNPRDAQPYCILQGHKNTVISVAMSPTGGLFATGSGDRTARVWSYVPLPQSSPLS